MLPVARIYLILLLLAAAALWFGGCSPDDPPTPTQPTFQPQPSGTRTVMLQAFPSKIAADGRSSSLIVANCYIGNQLAPNNLPVTFSTNIGEFSLNGVDPIHKTTPIRSFQLITAEGRANIYLLSDTQTGTAVVKAYFGVEATDTTRVKFIRKDKDVGSITLKLDPSEGTAPLTLQATATVKSRDDEVLSDVRVIFDIDIGGAKFDDKRVKTDSSGVASTFVRDISQDATITATAGGVTALQLVEITNEEAKHLELEAIGSTGSALKEPVLHNSRAQLVLRATVKSDAGGGGSVVQGARVNFSTDDGGANFTKNPVTTNSSGEAETIANNITKDAIVTASTKGGNDTLIVKINHAPIANINVLSGTATAGQVCVFVVSAENSWDVDTPYGDTITYNWVVTLETGGNITVTTSSTTAQVITVTVGNDTTTPGGPYPLSGDKLTIVLTVTDTNGLTDSTVTTITYP